MPISLKNLLKDIEKEFSKDVGREIEKLLTKQHTVYDAMVKSTLTKADVVLANLSPETITEIEASIQKFQIMAPTADTKPNPKVSSLLGAIIQHNIKNLDQKGDAIANTMIAEPTKRSMTRGG